MGDLLGEVIDQLGLDPDARKELIEKIIREADDVAEGKGEAYMEEYAFELDWIITNSRCVSCKHHLLQTD